MLDVFVLGLIVSLSESLPVNEWLSRFESMSGGCRILCVLALIVSVSESLRVNEWWM